LTDAAVTLN